MNIFEHDIVAAQIASKKLEKRIKNDNDPTLFEDVITKGNLYAKTLLMENPHLPREYWERLSQDEWNSVRSAVANHPNTPTDIFEKIRDEDEDHSVQVEALCNPRTEFSVYKYAVMNRKFSAWGKRCLSWNHRIVEDVEVFGFMWEKVKTSQTGLIRSLNYAHLNNRPNIDPECAHIVHDEMRKGNPSASLREEYAGASFIALPEILDTLKSDPSRPVINALAGNSASWVSTHEHLVANHKTPAIRISVARVTTDNDLLNKIYHGTKSKDIREAVEENPVFVNTKH